MVRAGEPGALFGSRIRTSSNQACTSVPQSSSNACSRQRCQDTAGESAGTGTWSRVVVVRGRPVSQRAWRRSQPLISQAVRGSIHLTRPCTRGGPLHCTGGGLLKLALLLPISWILKAVGTKESLGPAPPDFEGGYY